MKMHVVYDPKSDCPRILDITNANINDAEIGRTIEIVFSDGRKLTGRVNPATEVKPDPSAKP